MTLLPRDYNGCPYLLLAPMEGVGDRFFRKAIASIGGFDEAVKDFLRVPKNANAKTLARIYNADELTPIPLAAQIMGADSELMAEMARELENLGAPRIDINFGCPSNTVNGRGAGSTLLQYPETLFKISDTVCKSVSVPVTIKMRSGYKDNALYKENLLAAQESGIAYITIHPRTKKDFYHTPANWDLISEAKSLLKIPVVGNGDIFTVKDAIDILNETRCDALMIGRGSIINPFLFQQIKSHFSDKQYLPTWEILLHFFEVYLSDIPPATPNRIKINKLKQIFSYLFKGSKKLLEKRYQVLRGQHRKADDFMNFAISILKDGWQ